MSIFSKLNLLKLMEELKQVMKEEIKSTKSYIIISDKNNIFYLTIQNQFSTINILSYYYQDNIIKYNYEKEFKLEELKENKYLCLCDNINEIYDELINLLDKNKSKIIEGNNKIDLNIPIDNLKIKEIKFCINETNNNKFSIISKLKRKMNNLKEDNRNLREEINNLKEEIKNIKEDMYQKDKINLKINNIKEDLNNLKKDNNNNIKEEICNLNEEIDNIKENNSNLKGEINNLKKENVNR